jgi:hypothetical protein
MKIPMETVMKLPIQDRRYFIQKHNEEQDGLRSSYEKSRGGRVVDGDAINAYAKLEQENLKNMRGG